MLTAMETSLLSTDTSGNTAAQYTYDAWGNILSQSSGTIASANPLRYAGYMYDGATGLYYLMARYYDPGIGRFISKDTFHGFEDDPQSLNQYTYCNNNPVMYVDPNGHIAWSTRNFGYRLKWWGHKIWISHEVTQWIKGNMAAVTGTAGLGVIAPLQYLGVPGWISTIVASAIVLNVWWFTKQDRGGGVVIEVNWKGVALFVPAYEG